MPRIDPYAGDPTELRIGDHTLLSLACGITRGQHKKDPAGQLTFILWTIRYAFICGCQRGANEANETLDALLKLIPADANLPKAEDSIKAFSPEGFSA